MTAALLLCAAGLAALAAGCWLALRARRTVRRLDRMLTDAIDGGFVEEHYDETAVSALEARMARLLHGSAAANRALSREQAAVQSLISDISHQARTPMANILLYADLLEETDLTDAQRARLTPLRDQAEKLRFLIENLIRSSRLETGILQLAPAAGSVDALMEQAAGEAGAAAAVQPGGQRRQVHAARRQRGAFGRTDRQFLPGGCGGHRPRHPGKRAGRDLWPVCPRRRRPRDRGPGYRAVPGAADRRRAGRLHPGQKRAGAGQRVFAVSAPAGKRRIGRDGPRQSRRSAAKRPGAAPAECRGGPWKYIMQNHSAARRRSTTVWRAAAR